MNDTTRSTLSAINRRFYRQCSQQFSDTRSRPWPGWNEVVNRPPFVRPEHSRRSTPIRVLDVGCGNGRFGRFLDHHLEIPICYLGLDSSPDLVRIARRQLDNCSFRDIDIREFDILESDLSGIVEPHGFDVVVVFGVLHHLPGFSSRLSLLKRLESLLCDSGMLALSFWQFEESVAGSNRFVPWSRLTRWGFEAVDLGELEPGDHLLRWGPDPSSDEPGSPLSLRYCHHASDEEIERLIQPLNLSREEGFRADGSDGRSNRYELLRRSG